MKTQYRCTACNWKFSRTSEPRNCPYCGKEKVEVAKDLAADDLLKELGH